MLSVDGRNLAVLDLELHPRPVKCKRARVAPEEGLFKDWDLQAVRCTHCSSIIYYQALSASIEAFQDQVFAEIKPKESKQGVFMVCTVDKKAERKSHLLNYIK